MITRKRAFGIAALVLSLFLFMGQSANNFGGPSERLLGGPLCLKAAGKTLGPMKVTGVPVSGVLRVPLQIPGYGGGGDTLALQFNSDTGNNYRYWWLTAAPGGTTFAAGAGAATTDRVKLGQADTNNPRLINAFVSDVASKTEKLVSISDVTGTGAVGTQANIDLGNGAWVSAANTTINSITVMTTNNNMAAGTCIAAYGR